MVVGSVSGQHTYLSCGFDPQVATYWRQLINVPSHIGVSLSVSQNNNNNNKENNKRILR